MNHKYHRCAIEHCNVCNGGLQWCEVCGGGEASLTTECCGKPMGPIMEEQVQRGKLDFIRGRWIAKPEIKN